MNKNKKISFFLYSLEGGGVEINTLRLAKGFVIRGYDVDLVLAKAEGSYMSRLDQSIHVVNLASKNKLSCFKSLWSYLRKESPLALISAKDYANILGILVTKLSFVSTKIIVSIRTNVSHHFPTKIRSKRNIILSKIFYRWADGIVAVSKGVAKDLSKITGIPRDNITVIYNPIVTNKISNLMLEPVDHPWLKSCEQPVVIAVGRLNKQKDFPTLIKAFSIIRQSKNIRLIILGKGEEQSNLEKLVNNLKIEKDVSFVGFVDNPYAYMARSSVFVLSSAWEGFGNVIVESMATGTSVVSTDCPSGPREILEEGKYGLLVPVGDVERLAEAIMELLDKPIDPKILKKRAWQFSVDIAVDRYLELINKLTLK